MRPQEQYELVLYLVDLGLNDCQIERATRVPRRTVLDWRHGERKGTWAERVAKSCPICASAKVDEEQYAYLLGLYLGDGCISKHPRTYRLRISLDERYPGIIRECSEAIEAMRSGMTAYHQQCVGCIEVNAYWNHWPCVFPQHGPGIKHLRTIELEQWQRAIVERQSHRFLRGLIHSDGWRGVNRVNNTDYPRYEFSNTSADIREIFCWACDVYGVRWRRMKWNAISVARKDDVARLDQVIGLKS